MDLSSYTVLDRGFEYASRSGRATSDIAWRADNPTSRLQVLSSSSVKKNNIQLDVVWRTVELPTNQGFGSQELLKIEIDEDTPGVLRAALVKRRFRRNFDAQQRRIVEGIEVVQTFRVLDGVAGTEFPTSTIKSQLLLTRPQEDGYDVPSGAY